MVREEPLLNCRFIVEIDGIQRSGFTEAFFFEANKEWIEYREGIRPNLLPKLGAKKRLGVLTLKAGVTDSTELSRWYQNFAKNPSRNKKNISIVVLNSAGVKAAKFEIFGAGPVKYAVGPLDAKGNDVLYEFLDIVFERIHRSA